MKPIQFYFAWAEFTACGIFVHLKNYGLGAMMAGMAILMCAVGIADRVAEGQVSK